jgi:phospholipase D1/2
MRRPHDSMTDSPLLVEGRTCWRLARAGRAAFLVDGATYFAAVAAAFERAQKRIWIVGWDLNTHVRLRRNGDGGVSDQLGPLLHDLLRRRRHLHVHVLKWDFAILYAIEHEILPLVSSRPGIKSHRRLHFRYDNHHPTGASHHQKIVVVDDSIAFAGGLDLTHCRWDTPQHRADDPRRSDPGFPSYGPFHDVQMAVDGEAAAALGELVRRRWKTATGRAVRAASGGADCWPTELRADVRNVGVGIARTQPQYDGNDEVREVERLHLDAIARARRFIYLENQYVSASRIGDALAERLREEDGPEVLLVVPRRCSGWLEESTMGVLRDRFLDRLREADRFQRLHVFYPTAPGVGDNGVFVHAKVAIIDDVLLRIGSANLANRSMGLDTECDLAIEANGNAEVAAAITGFHARLLGEHLGAETGRVVEALRREAGLVRTIDSLRGDGRTLEPFVSDLPPWAQELVPQEAVFDPERPVDFERMAAQVLPADLPEEAGRGIGRVTATIIFIAVAAVAWYATPLREWLRPETLAAQAAWLRESTAGPLVAITGFVVGGLLLVPLTAFIVASVIVFGPVTGFVISMTGSLLSGTLGYLLGRALWRDAVRRIAGERLNRLSRRLAKRGVLTVAAVRMIPVAPYGIVNLVAGASHIGFRDFLFGSFVGLLPGMLGITIFADRAWMVVTRGGSRNIALLVVVLIVVGASLIWLQHRLQKLAARPPAQPDEEKTARGGED